MLKPFYNDAGFQTQYNHAVRRQWVERDPSSEASTARDRYYCMIGHHHHLELSVSPGAVARVGLTLNSIRVMTPENWRLYTTAKRTKARHAEKREKRRTLSSIVGRKIAEDEALRNLNNEEARVQMRGDETTTDHSDEEETLENDDMNINSEEHEDDGTSIETSSQGTIDDEGDIGSDDDETEGESDGGLLTGEESRPSKVVRLKIHQRHK